jgi:hypothetical protein
MSLVAASIPEDPAELAGWLESRLVGFDLGPLVAELAAVHGRTDGPMLAEVLGAQRSTVLAEGLSALPPDALRQLLSHPRLLLELQELVLSTGGAYWQRLVGADPSLDELIRRGQRRLEAALGRTAPPVVRPRPRPRVLRFVPPMVTAFAGAAAALVLIWIFREPLARRLAPAGAPAAAWGWQKLPATAEGVSAAGYLNQLADAAQEWFKKQPEDAPALAARIGQMRQGCSQLIFARHEPLSEEDRRWLVGKCREWALKFDKAQEDLDSGQPVARVREGMDQTVNKLVDALRKRAEQQKPT